MKLLVNMKMAHSTKPALLLVNRFLNDLSQQAQSLFASIINDNMQSVSDYLSDLAIKSSK
jgi:hypothetical protein